MLNSKLKHYTLDEILQMMVNEEITSLSREDGLYLEYLIKHTDEELTRELDEALERIEELEEDLSIEESDNLAYEKEIQRLNQYIKDNAEQFI